MLNVVTKLLIGLLILYILQGTVIYFFQRNFMYLPPEMHPGLSTTTLQDMNEVRIKSSLGHEVTSWWHPPEPNEGVVVFFHGNGSSVFDGRFMYQHWIAEGYGVLGVEYPGYPGSTGKPSQRALIATAEAHYEFLINQGVSSGQINLHGMSLGAGVAAQLASQHDVKKLVLECPFNSMADMAQLRVPIYPSFLTRDRYRSDRAIQNLKIPVLWIHGTNDIVIPITQGQKLYDSYAGPKDKLIIANGNHVNLWINGGREEITNFFSK